MKIIALDSGHSLKTAGKQTPDGIKEWSLNDKVRDKVCNILSAYDCKIIHTDNDEGIVDESLASRVSKYINAGAEAFVSLHHNAFTGKWGKHTGIEVYVDKKATAEDLRLANLIYDKLVRYTSLKGRGVKRADFQVINQNKVPAVLVEGGFMDSSIDYLVITSDEGQTAYAKAVAEALIEFCNLSEKEAPSIPQSTPTPARKTVDELAREVMAGLHGNGHENRKASLAKQGYNNYEEVRARVNELSGIKTNSAPKVNYYDRYSGKTSSIVTALNSLGIGSSFANRKNIAKANGISNYVGTASQNIKLLNLLKQGKLIKP